MHILVAGSGIAGVAATDALVQAGHRVTLVSDGHPGATALAALVNPFTGPRASAAWRYEDALSALSRFLERQGVSLAPGLVRPARDAKQADAFRSRAAEHPDALAWHDAAPPDGVCAPFGWLDVRVGGVWPDPAADLARHVARLKHSGRLQTVTAMVQRAEADATRVNLHVQTLECDGVIEADAAVLALGPGLWDVVPQLAAHLHRVKGETFEAQHVDALQLPAVAAGGYAHSEGPGTVRLGGTYDHSWHNLVPDTSRGEALRDRLAETLPGLGPLVPGTARAGLRVQRPHIRRPLLMPLDQTGRLWAFGALGAKGLLHAPLVASWLPTVLNNPAELPDDLRA
ncbi:MAG: FAD-binding oxidoreductase [Rhodothermales bacterium]|nr:FAD-binding oxidoreductase [Rhodothermales bacterium]